MHKFWRFNAQQFIVQFNHTVLYSSKLLRDYLLNFSQQKRNYNYGVMAVLANTVVIVVQYINVWNQQSIHLKITQCYKAILSQKGREGREEGPRTSQVTTTTKRALPDRSHGEKRPSTLQMLQSSRLRLKHHLTHARTTPLWGFLTQRHSAKTTSQAFPWEEIFNY